MTSVYLTDLGIINCLGSSKTEIWENTINGSQEKLLKNPIISGKEIYTGTITDKLPKIKDRIYNCRTNQILLHCLNQIEDSWVKISSKYASERIGIIVSSNNVGMDEARKHLASGASISLSDLKLIESGICAEFLQSITKVGGLCYGISTACSSGAKSFSSARNLIKNDICDAILVGGVDDISMWSVYGFDSLCAISKGKTNPFSVNRNGINLGEGGAIFIMEKDCEGIQVCGIGESSDAYHVTSPDPSGYGAFLAMKGALEDANLRPEEIDYINLHGTGTVQNDEMEAKAVRKLFGDKVLCSSSKALTGHLLGAAGSVEAGLCWLMLSEFNKNNDVIPHIYDGCDMPQPISLVKKGTHKKITYCLSNSFAFGGSNASVILKNSH